MKAKKGFGQVLSVSFSPRARRIVAAERLSLESGKNGRVVHGKEMGEKHHSRNPINRYSSLHSNEMPKGKNKSLEIAVHKFNIPLNAIIAAADDIGNQYDTLTKQNILDEVTGIKTAAAYMLAILNDFLSTEAIDKRKIQPVINSFDLKNLTENVVRKMKRQTRDWQDIKYTHTGYSKISLDKKLLEHCLVNLISNAIKYSDVADYIEVGSEINDDMCRIWVKDYGIGIPEEEKDRLFEPFFRASNVSQITGTGLGLNLVKRYVELMGGRVTMEENATKGTVFNLIFPVKS